MGVWLEKKHFLENKIIAEYDNINSRFNNLSNDLQSFFYNQQLLKFQFSTQDNSLLSEKYFFYNGFFTRTYFYKNHKIEKIVIEAKYKDGRAQRLNRQYNYK